VARRFPTPSATPRCRGERGGALVEFAMAFPVFMLLLLAVVDMGVNYGDRVQTAHAAREAARAGSVSKVGTTTGCYIDGTVTNSLSQSLICLAKARTHKNPADVRVKVFYEGANGKATSNYNPPTGMSSSPTSTIVVCVMSRAQSISGMLNPIFSGKAHKSMSLVKTANPAPTAGGVYPPPAAENALPGHNWAWCAPEDPVGTDP
jgi:Flp pilus assembly protein TadG